jgi:TonB family protein
MKYRAFALTLCLLSTLSPAPARAGAGGDNCSTVPARLVGPPKLSLPADAKITSKEMAFEIDIGSDGRVRGLQLDESSGDNAVDSGARQSLQAARFEPPQTGCVAYSGALLLTYDLPVEGSTHLGPPVGLNTNCTPYVLAFLSPAARERKRTGTAVVAVTLDTTAGQTAAAAPELRKSTGSPVLDQEALRIARTGLYNFLHGSTCATRPLTYDLELTFQ